MSNSYSRRSPARPARPPSYPYDFRHLTAFPNRLLFPPSAGVGNVRSFKITPIYDVSLNDVLDGKHLPPLTLKDFEDYLVFEAHSAENLYFICWLRDYTAKYNQWEAEQEKLPDEKRTTSNPDLTLSFARARNTFFDPSSHLELNLPGDLTEQLLRDTKSIAHPSPATLSEVQKHVEGMLRESLMKFVVGSCRNAGRRRGLFAIIVGFAAILVGLAPVLMSVLRGESRAVRVAALFPFWFGAMTAIAGLHGVCVVIFLFGDARQLYPYELARPTLASVPAMQPLSLPLPVTMQTKNADSASSFIANSEDENKHNFPLDDSTKAIPMSAIATPSAGTTAGHRQQGSASTTDFDYVPQTAGFIQEPSYAPSIGGSTNTGSAGAYVFDFDSLPGPPSNRRSSEEWDDASSELRERSMFASLTKVFSPLVTRAQWDIVMRSALLGALVALILGGISIRTFHLLVFVFLLIPKTFFTPESVSCVSLLGLEDLSSSSILVLRSLLVLLLTCLVILLRNLARPLYSYASFPLFRHCRLSCLSLGFTFRPRRVSYLWYSSETQAYGLLVNVVTYISAREPPIDPVNSIHHHRRRSQSRHLSYQFILNPHFCTILRRETKPHPTTHHQSRSRSIYWTQILVPRLSHTAPNTTALITFWRHGTIPSPRTREDQSVLYDSGVINYTRSQGEETLRNLGLTSRRFRALVLPVLLERFKCTVTNRTNVEQQISRVDSLLSLLHTRPEIKFWFKDVTITVPSAIPISTPLRTKTLVLLLTNFVVRLEGVRALVWSQGPLPGAVYAQLPRMRALQKLILSRLSSVDDIPNDIIAGETPSIWYLKVDIRRELLGTRRYSQLPPKALQALQSLTFLPSITHLDTQICIMDAGLPLGATLESAPYCRLLELELELIETEAPRLPDVLSGCPSLTTLRLHQTAEPLSVTPLLMPKTVAPLLEEISGPFCYVRAFIQGRPLRKVSARFPLRGAPLAREHIEILSCGSVDIMELELRCIKWNPTVLPNIIELLPNLESLAIDAAFQYNYMDALQDVVRNNLIHPRLRYLHLSAPAVIDLVLHGDPSTGQILSLDSIICLSDYNVPEHVANEVADKWKEAVLDCLTISGASFPSLTSARFEYVNCRREDGEGSWSHYRPEAE